MEQTATTNVDVSVHHSQTCSLDSINTVHYGSRSTGQSLHNSSSEYSGVPLDQAAAALAEDLYAIEPNTRLYVDEIFERAVELERAAGRLGLDHHRMRAQLIIADIQVRRGQGAIGGVALQGIRQWADSHQDDYLLARADRAIAHFYYRLADHALALEAAVNCVRYLPEWAPANIMVDQRLTLADCLAATGSFGAAVTEYNDVIRMASSLGDPAWQLAALNNMAYSYYRMGDRDGTHRVLARMQELAGDAEDLMEPAWIDTMARMHSNVGRYEQARLLTAPVLERRAQYQREKMLGVGECILAYAEASRQSNHLDDADEALQAAEALIDTYTIEILRVELLHEQAAHAAACHDMARAYQLQRRAFELAEAAKSDERDGRSRTLLALHEMLQARADIDRFRILSLLDPLTALGNRRFVSETLTVRLERARATGRPLAIALFDLDHFKKVNDTWSHQVGDQVLQEVAAVLARQVGMSVVERQHRKDLDTLWDIDIERVMQSSDEPYAARMGGEEFLLVVPGLTAAEARRAMEHILDQVRHHQWREELPVRKVTGSIGLVVTRGETPMGQVLRTADELLYLAKREGRDRVAGPPELR